MKLTTLELEVIINIMGYTGLKNEFFIFLIVSSIMILSLAPTIIAFSLSSYEIGIETLKFNIIGLLILLNINK